MISCVGWVPRGCMSTQPEQTELAPEEMEELIHRQQHMQIQTAQSKQHIDTAEQFSEDDDDTDEDEEGEAEGLEKIGQHVNTHTEEEQEEELEEQQGGEERENNQKQETEQEERHMDTVTHKKKRKKPQISSADGAVAAEDVPMSDAAGDPTASDPADNALLEELHMSDYDDEPEGAELFLGGHKLTVHSSNAEDPYITLPDEADEDSDDEDETIHSTDSVLIVARTEQEHSAIELYVYDEENSNLFVHHDFQIPSFPLCFTWCNQDPRLYYDTEQQHEEEAEQEEQEQQDNLTVNTTPGSFLAVGTFLPGIEIWNLDVLSALEPVATLGGYEDEDVTSTSKKKGKRSRKLKAGSHSDAVLCLAWHPLHRERLASGSADETVKLWDITTQQCTQTLEHHQHKAAEISATNATQQKNGNKHKKDKEQKKKKKKKRQADDDDDEVDDESWFNEAQALNASHKVQSLHWNPNEPSLLLTGSYDRTVHLVDVRVSAGGTRMWTVEADVEQVRWHPSASFTPLFLTSTENGLVYLFDARKPTEAIFRLAAHTGATTAIDFNSHIPSLFLTAGADKTVKLWDIAALTSTGSAAASASPVAPTLVTSKEMKVGAIWSAAWEADSAYLLACGGDKGKLAVWDVRESSEVDSTYRKQLNSSTREQTQEESTELGTASKPRKHRGSQR